MRAYQCYDGSSDIGIGMEVEAQNQEVTGMFFRNGLILTGIGEACGLVAAFLSMRFLATLLFGVKPVDLLSYSTVSIGLVATAMLASYLPSRKAAIVDPLEALRGE